MRPFKQAALAAVLAAAFCAPAIAQIADKDKWSPGDQIFVLGTLCTDLAEAKKAMEIRVVSESLGIPGREMHAMIGKSLASCQYVQNMHLTFGGVVEGEEPMETPSGPIILAKFSNPGGSAYSWVDTGVVSDQELPQAIPQMWQFEGTGEYLLPT